MCEDFPLPCGVLLLAAPKSDYEVVVGPVRQRRSRSLQTLNAGRRSLCIFEARLCHFVFCDCLLAFALRYVCHSLWYIARSFRLLGCEKDFALVVLRSNREDIDQKAGLTDRSENVGINCENKRAKACTIALAVVYFDDSLACSAALAASCCFLISSNRFF